MPIILISGHAGAGKTTLGNFISETYNKPSLEIALADKLKEITFKILKLCHIQIDSIDDLYNRETKEQYRHYLQQIGTEICQTSFGKTCWCEAIRKDIEDNKNKLILITDIRFKHEIEWFKKNYKDVLCIKVSSNRIVQSAQFHISEQEVDELKCDYFIDNNSTLDNLKEEAKNIINLIH